MSPFLHYHRESCPVIVNGIDYLALGLLLLYRYGPHFFYSPLPTYVYVPKPKKYTEKEKNLLHKNLVRLVPMHNTWSSVGSFGRVVRIDPDGSVAIR